MLWWMRGGAKDVFLRPFNNIVYLWCLSCIILMLRHCLTISSSCFWYGDREVIVDT